MKHVSVTSIAAPLIAAEQWMIAAGFSVGGIQYGEPVRELLRITPSGEVMLSTETGLRDTGVRVQMSASEGEVAHALAKHIIALRDAG